MVFRTGRVAEFLGLVSLLFTDSFRDCLVVLVDVPQILCVALGLSGHIGI